MGVAIDCDRTESERGGGQMERQFDIHELTLNSDGFDFKPNPERRYQRALGAVRLANERQSMDDDQSLAVGNLLTRFARHCHCCWLNYG